MNRAIYYNYIEDKLGSLAHRINAKGKLNILDLHLHSENFYLEFLNNLYGWQFGNLNPFQQNVEAIDLIDHTNKFVCQVSATNTKQKVESALDKDIIKTYPGYTFKFISISRDAANLRGMKFKNPHQIQFNPATDIIDNNSILNAILGAKIDKQRLIYDFINKELGNNFDIVKFDSNLSTIINILSKEDFSSPSTLVVDTFQIERKIDHNKLLKTRLLIEQKRVFCQRVANQYKALDVSGANRSFSVLHAIEKSYIEEMTKGGNISEDELFLNIIENVSKKVTQGANYVSIALEELDFCVCVLVVDAFIRCKIFVNPSNYQYAIA